MSLVELLVIAVVAVAGVVLLVWGARVQARQQRQQEVPRPSAVEIELDTMRRAARLRDFVAAAEAHMDEFIANREAEQQRMQSNVVDGEVIQVRDERHERRWPR